MPRDRQRRGREGGGRPKNVDPADYGTPNGGGQGGGQGGNVINLGGGGGRWKQFRQFMNSPMGWLWMQQMFNQGGEEEEGNSGTIYEDDVTYNQVPGQGTYLGDESALSGMPGMGALPAQPSTSGSIGGSGGSSPYASPEMNQQLLPDPETVTVSPKVDPENPNPLYGPGGQYDYRQYTPEELMKNGVVNYAQPTGTPHVPVKSGGSKLGIPQAYQTFRQAGFGDEQARLMTAIAMGESGLDPMAHNPNAATGDNSYGLTQVNMLGDLGPARMREYGLKSNEDLFDPLTNAKAAFGISGGGKNFSPWSVYKKGVHNQYMDDVNRALLDQLATAPSTPGTPPPADPTKPETTPPKKDEDEDEDED